MGMLKPKRHQRSRKSGSKLPDGVVCVTRPGRWGNPFVDAATFRYVLTQIVYDGVCATPMSRLDFLHMTAIAATVHELRGKDLACWCSLDAKCHADVLLEFANKEMKR
jgi:hypothetical protein